MIAGARFGSAQGLAEASQLDAGTIQDFVRANPTAGADLMNVNPSYVFFRKIADLPDRNGPIGAWVAGTSPAMTAVGLDARVKPAHDGC